MYKDVCIYHGFDMGTTNCNLHECFSSFGLNSLLNTYVYLPVNLSWDGKHKI